MPILISIGRAAERQERIREQGIEAELLQESVDGLQLKDPKSYLSLRAYYDFDKKKTDHRTITTFGGIGCYMSHENAWKKVVASNKPELILEDDVTVLEDDYMSKVNEWIEEDHSQPRVKWLQYGYLSDDPPLHWGSAAYLINPLAAKCLLENSRPIETQIDSYVHLMIMRNNWVLEKAVPPLFAQHETSQGSFKTLCQDGNDHCSANKYMYVQRT